MIDKLQSPSSFKSAFDAALKEKITATLNPVVPVVEIDHEEDVTEEPEE
jgi:hypothetical protein